MKQAAAGPFGGGSLPIVCAGGYVDQPAAMIDAFAILERLLNEQLANRPDG